MKRNYIAIYFPLIDEAGKRHTRNICVSFGEKEKILFGRVKKLHSHEIKKSIGIFSYRQLIAHSQKENRKPTELIKLLLTEKLIQKRKQIKRTVEFNPEKVKKWFGALKNRKRGFDGEITNFLEGITKNG